MTRWFWLLLPFGMLLSTLGSSSCIQLGPNDSNAGASGDDGGAPSATVEDQCTSIVTEFCSRAQDCYGGQDPDACLQTGVDSCCGRACKNKATSSEHAIDLCVLDLKAASCDTIDAATYDSTQLPDRCQNVVTY